MMRVVGCDLCVECHMQSSMFYEEFEKDIKEWNPFVIGQHLINKYQHNI